MPWKPYDDPDDEIPVGGLTPMPWVPHSKDLATWVTKGPNCPACEVLSGRSYPLAYWQATVMPGWHDNCDCRLSVTKVNVLESPHDLWGTEPYWWDPTQTPLQYLADTLKRFINYFSNTGKGDQYSGFDVLDPVFKSKNWFTTAGWTLKPKGTNNFPLLSLFYQWTKNYTFSIYPTHNLQLWGYTGIIGSPRALLNSNKKVLKAKLPWEAATTTKTPKPWWYKNQ